MSSNHLVLNITYYLFEIWKLFKAIRCGHIQHLIIGAPLSASLHELIESAKKNHLFLLTLALKMGFAMNFLFFPSFSIMNSIAFFYSFNFFSCIRKKNPTFHTHENDGFIWTYASWFFFLYWLSTILAIVKIFPFRIDWKADMSFRLFSGLRRTSLFEYFRNEREIISFDYSKILPSFFSEWIH